MKMMFVICSCMLLCCSAALATLSVSDNFNDGYFDFILWNDPFYMGNASTTETNAHLHFYTLDDPGIDAYRAIVPLRALAPFNRNWEVQIFTAFPDFENDATQQLESGLILVPHEISEVLSNRVSHTMAKDEANQKMYYQNVEVNGVEIFDYGADRISDTALLRMRWQAANSNLYSDISIDGGTTWTSYWPSIENPFGMASSDQFVVTLYAASKGRSIAISDNVYLDDFHATIYSGPLNGSDDFNDNTMDSAKWSEVPPLLAETNNRLEYTASGSEDEFGMWIWTPNAGSCTQNWSVTIDAHNSSTPLTAEQNGNVEIAVFKDGGKNFWVGLAAEGAGGGTDRKIDVGWILGDDDIELKLPIDSESATLRIAYDSTSKTLFGQYDIGDGFVSVTNFNTDNWGLIDSDSLSIWVAGYSDNLLISSGQIYADNFVAVTLLNRATITNCYPVAGGFMLEWVPVEEWGSVVKWSTNLISMPFTNLSANLAYPLNSYTDTVHGAEAECFYRVDVRME